MSTTESFGDSNPRAELSSSRVLARRVRREQRATWFPLLVFAVVTFLAIPVTRARPYVITGLVLAVGVSAASIWAARTVLTGRYDILGWHLQGQDVYRLIGPACAIGLALLILAAVDRSPALLAVTLAYLLIAIGGVDFGWTISRPSPWAFAPHLVIAGSLLLLASAGFALVQLPRRHLASSHP